MMSKQSQQDKAQTLLKLHTHDDLLVLPNVWNPIGARVLQAKGYPAVATASAAVSASLGYEDGERLKRTTLIDCLERIASSVDVPVTADIEAGYGASLEELAETIELVLDAGIVGINLEDSVLETSGLEGEPLRPIDEQCQRIATVRQTAERRGIHLVINARVDCFLSGTYADPAEAMRETVARAAAYVEAGADSIYPIGPGDAETVRALRSQIHAPINILVSPSSAPLSELRQIGINRVSFGPFVFRAWLRQFVDMADGLREGGNFAVLGHVLSGSEEATFLRTRHE